MPDINDIPPMSDEGMGSIPPVDGLTPIDAFNLGVSIGKRNAALEERPDEFELCHNCRVLTAKYGRDELASMRPVPAESPGNRRGNLSRVEIAWTRSDR